MNLIQTFLQSALGTKSNFKIFVHISCMKLREWRIHSYKICMMINFVKLSKSDSLHSSFVKPFVGQLVLYSRDVDI